MAHYGCQSEDDGPPHRVLPLFLGDQHLTTVIPCSHRAWPEEWAEPVEKLLEKQADMRAAGVRVRSEGLTCDQQE